MSPNKNQYDITILLDIQLILESSNTKLLSVPPLYRTPSVIRESIVILLIPRLRLKPIELIILRYLMQDIRDMLSSLKPSSIMILIFILILMSFSRNSWFNSNCPLSIIKPCHVKTLLMEIVDFQKSVISLMVSMISDKGNYILILFLSLFLSILNYLYHIYLI